MVEVFTSSGDEPDVRVEHCKLTVRRHGGWSWGAQPTEYLDAALARLEEVILAAVDEAEVRSDIDDLTISEPVRIQLSATGQLTSASKTSIIAAVQSASAAAPAPTAAESLNDQRPSSRQLLLRSPEEVADLDAAQATAALLALWSTSGQAFALLRPWPEPLLRAWIDHIATLAARPSSGATDIARPAIEAIATALFGESPDPVQPLLRVAVDAAAMQLALIAAVTAARGATLPSRAAQRAIAEAVAERIGPDDGADSSSLTQDAPQRRGDRASQSQERPAAVLPDIVPVLPFLVLDQLERIGYLDAVIAAANVAELDAGPLGIVASIIGKTLPAPQRGWLRTPAQTGAVAAGAGATDLDMSVALAELVNAADSVVPILSATLVAAYASGRSTFEPVVITSMADAAIVCGEADGVLPIAWSGSNEENQLVLATLGSPPAETNDTFAEFAAVLGAHRAAPGLNAPALERHLGAAVGTALGLLTRQLWPGLADPSPLVLLERFGDLESRIIVEKTSLRVGVPRGQRWLDIRDAGLLRSTPIPWMPGGVLEVETW